MHVHILGIAGTFMGGVAAIAKAAGFRVTGSDLNVYPPMSTQLTAMGIDYVQGYGAEQLDLKPDMVVVGNALSRGRELQQAQLGKESAFAQKFGIDSDPRLRLELARQRRQLLVPVNPNRLRHSVSACTIWGGL